MKLTAAQQRVFDEMMRLGCFNCIYGYKPAEKLIELGLAVSVNGSFGRHSIVPTQAAKDRTQ